MTKKIVGVNKSTFGQSAFGKPATAGFGQASAFGQQSNPLLGTATNGSGFGAQQTPQQQSSGKLYPSLESVEEYTMLFGEAKKKRKMFWRKWPKCLKVRSGKLSNTPTSGFKMNSTNRLGDDGLFSVKAAKPPKQPRFETLLSILSPDQTNFGGGLATQGQPSASNSMTNVAPSQAKGGVLPKKSKMSELSKFFIVALTVCFFAYLFGLFMKNIFE